MSSDVEDTVELTDIHELQEQVSFLKKRLSKLVRKVEDDDTTEPPCVDWSLYEQQVSNDPMLFMKKYLENKEATMEKIKTVRLRKMVGCLRFFKGENLSEKRCKLLKFLKRAPGYRTLNIKLLEQRLYITRKWMRENNIDMPLEALPLEVKLDV